MTIDKATVTKIAALARLRVEESEKDLYARQLGGLMHWIEQLQEVNTDAVAPLASVSEITLPLRPDVVNDGNIQAAVLSNAPETVAGFYVVPKIVE